VQKLQLTGSSYLRLEAANCASNTGNLWNYDIMAH